MTPITIWLPCNPSTSTQQGGGKRMAIVKGKPMFFKNEKEQSWREVLTSLLLPHVPDKPIEGPLAIELTFVFPLTKADQSTKAKRAALEEFPLIFHPQKPDTHNAVKTPIDVMQTLGFFVDDKQIVRDEVYKFRGVTPGLLIQIFEPELGVHGGIVLGAIGFALRQPRIK